MRNLILGSLLLGLTVSAQAVSFKNVVNGVWNSGLTDSAVLLTAPAADSHFVLIQPAGCTVPSPPVSCSGFGTNAVLVVGPSTNGTWPSGNGTDSQWIGPRGDQNPVIGPSGIYANASDFYVYRMIFNLSALGLLPNTANISLRWIADNNVNSTNIPTANSHIRLCSIPNAANRTVCDPGSTVAGSNAGAENTPVFTNAPVVNIGPALLNAGFMALDFVVYNSPIAFGENPTGMRLEILSANADIDPNAVPEPLSFTLMGLGLIGFGLYSRRK